MPKNKGKGGKNRRRGKNESDKEQRELQFKEEFQDYAQVLRLLGNGRLETKAFDDKGTIRLAHIRGKMRKKVWISNGDIILLSLRDFQDEKADVILKYSADEARKLKSYEELPANAKINETDLGGEIEEETVGFEFGEEDEDVEEEDDEEEETKEKQDIDVDTI